ncbi:alpha/beta hydrolase fold-domain-containing protein [Coniella lustricola]|uniref:Alpha/beta hydrolase fold-domain-containing protein n=1 Tax=Coniella lustricola TaxID=2025994 RepID=A0A2T2ZWT6_9PEZI|nr:alpha/beta hydrolase fold-domain-containing protein [Coniella lustricola]
MDENAKLVLELLAKVPLMARVALLHLLGRTPPSQYVDLRTELTVAVLRSFLEPSKPTSITATQKLLNRDPGIKGRIWVAKYTALPPPEPSSRDALVRAIESMNRSFSTTSSSSSSLKTLQWPEAIAVEAEWTGYRANATPSSILPAVAEADKYAELMKEVRSPVTVLYLHGGAYFLMDPATHRPTTKKIAKLTGGRCYSVRYRLAPQSPFPAALLDALHAYLTLLYPPEGAFHEAVQPEHVVLAGDSAGGNLCMALTQLLLEFRRTKTIVEWHGRAVSMPLPAGVALSSPWLDMTHSSASCMNNAPFDYLPALQGIDQKPRPSCPAWPTNPPRRMLYCADAVILHPLVTLLAAKDWEGCPPVFISAGWELLADEDKYMAAYLHAQNVPVVWEQYEGMPHCFAMVLNDHLMSKRCFASWAGFIKDVVEKQPGTLKSSFRIIRAKSLQEIDVDPVKLAPFTEETLWARLKTFAEQSNTPRASGDVAAKL